MGHTHGTGQARVASSKMARWVLAGILVPVLGLTIWGILATWPEQLAGHGEFEFHSPDSVELRVQVMGPVGANSLGPAQLVDGAEIEVIYPPEHTVMDLSPGTPPRVLYVPEAQDSSSPYMFLDFERGKPMLLLFFLYVAAVVIVAKWRGMASIAGLAFSLLIVITYTLPSLLIGGNGLLVAMLTSSAVMFAVMYVAHGISARTSIALLGTLGGLLITAALAAGATRAAQITGLTDDYVRSLLFFAPSVDLRAIVLCGTVLACLGALNDVTITQASAVWELREVNSAMSRLELFRRSMRIGRDHIASTVYTITFAYIGGALPLLLTVSMVNEAFAHTLTAGEIATEIVRTLVGSIGLVLAIPLTTAIAVVVVHGPGRDSRRYWTSERSS